MESPTTPQRSVGGDVSGDRVHAGNVVVLRLRDPSQLFDPLDPSPLLERDLSRDTEHYVVDRIGRISSNEPCALVLSIDSGSGDPDEARSFGDAIRAHFARRSLLSRRHLRQLVRRGAVSLSIGVGFLGFFFLIGQLLVRLLGENSLTRLLTESLIIGGWVAMWRPLEIFLYDWWPLVGERRLHDRLSRMEVRVIPGSALIETTPRTSIPR